MDIENDQIINSALADAAVDSTYVVVSIILIFLFGLGLCALEGSFINYNLAIGRFNFRPLGVLDLPWMATSDIIIKFDEGHSGSHI
jgi:hypothetical protein